tara:strand:- start:34661 stop:35509 length:849 start_codon:yes stop_codon:yes gene_type:complete
MGSIKYLSFTILFLLASNLYSQNILYAELKNKNWDIYSFSLKNGITKRMTKNSLKDFQSDYSNAQNKIVFDSYRDKNTRNIFTLNIQNKKITQLTALQSRDGHPVWSSNGSRIAFQSSRTGDSEVFIMDSRGKKIQQMTFSNGFDGIPKWSPDDKLLAFNSSRSGSPNIYTIDLKSKETHQITSDSSSSFVQDWISQTEILIITTVSERRQMQVLDIKSNKRINIKTEGNVTYARCNKNNEIVFTQKATTGEVNVFLINPDGSNLRQLTNSKYEKRFPAFFK